MSILKISLKCIKILSKRHRRILFAGIILQLAINLGDIAAIAMVGALGALGANYVAGISLPSWITSGLNTLGLSNFSIQSLIVYISILTATLFILKSVLTSIGTLKLFKFIARRQSEISTNLVSSLASANFKWLRKQNQQQITFTVIDGVNAMTIGIIGNFILLVSDISLLFFIAIVLIVIDPTTALFTFVFFGLVSIILNKAIKGMSLKFGEQLSTSTIKGRSQVESLLKLYREISVASKQSYFVDEFRSTRQVNSNSNGLALWLQQFPKFIFEISLVIGAAALVAYQVWVNDASNVIGVLFIFLAAAGRLIPALMRIQNSVLQVNNFKYGANLTLDLISDLNDLNVKFKSIPRTVQINGALDIHITDVSFSYEDSGKPVFTNLSLTVNSGEVTAIVGPSGAGKTTLIDLILGIYKPNKGEVYLSSKSQRVNPESVLNFAYVPQMPSLINGSLQENITLGSKQSEVDTDLLRHAITSSGLDNLIKNLPNGLDTKIDSIGNRLSGGELQRISIARALYLNAKLIVLDEGTSSLDGNTEKYVTDYLFSLKGEVTIIIVAHRLSSIKMADNIYYLEEGEIKGSGKFNELQESLPGFAEQVKNMSLEA
jgi:ABC-type multidrug transport system fused ATPase/permease subunit